MSYIFEQPAPLRQRNNYHTINTTVVRASPFKRHKKFLENEQSHNQESKATSKNIYKGIVYKGKTPLSKLNVQFEE